MNTNDTDNTDVKKQGLIYENLTYEINGVLFATHNEVGPYGREKQYCDVAMRIFKEGGMKAIRETRIGDSGNIIDIIVAGLVPLEFKAKRILTKEDYYQMQRYLQETGLKLGILVNFRDKTLRPRRVVKIDHWKN